MEYRFKKQHNSQLKYILLFQLIYNIFDKMEHPIKQKPFKIRYRLSYNPSNVEEENLEVETKIDNKQKDIKIQHDSIKERILDVCNGISNIVHKNRHISSGLFKNAHKIQKKETFLSAQKKWRESITKGSSSPRPHLLSSKKLNKKINGFIATNSTNSLKLISPSNETKQKQKLIQRTISIKIQGDMSDEKQNKDLITSLSRLILNKSTRHDGFELQLIDQSSIHGDEENFIDVDGMFF